MSFRLLNELTGYHKFENQDFNAIVDYMRDQGFSNSEGSFAIAFKNKDFVYKCWIKDPAYEDYLEKIILPLQNNPWVPKIIGKLHKIPIVSDRSSILKDAKMYVQKMELLISKPDRAISKALLNYFARSMIEKKAINPSSYSALRKIPLLSLPIFSIFNKEQLKSLDQYIDLVRKVFRDELDMIHKIDTQNDANIMFRGTQPVFIDMFFNLDIDHPRKENTGKLIHLLTKPESHEVKVYYGHDPKAKLRKTT